MPKKLLTTSCTYIYYNINITTNKQSCGPSSHAFYLWSQWEKSDLNLGPRGPRSEQNNNMT